MQTPAKIAFRHVKYSDAVVAFIHEKIAGLETFSDQIISCDVMVEQPHHHHRHGNVFHVRIDLRLPRHELVVSRGPEENKTHEDLYATIQDAFEQAKRLIEDYVRRQRVI